MEENFVSFRKAKVGGFNKKDVISYIEKMRNDFFDYKKAVEATIDQLNAKVRELEAACAGQKEQVREVIVEVPVAVETNTDPLNDINEATSQLRLVADELCKSLTDFMLKMTAGDQSPIQASVKTEIFENVSAYIEETAKEIFEEASEASSHEAEEIVNDKVADILNSSINFSFTKENSVRTEQKTEEPKKEKNILDCLNSCSFLG